MSPATIVLNSKTLRTSEPYEPQASAADDLIGRTQECRMVIAAWMAQPSLPPLAPLLVGEPGMGKNRLIYELARATSKPLYVLQGHEDVTAEDLVCAVRFSDEADRRMDYILSPLATAMLRGGICFIDEVGKLRAKALAPLASVLDERRYLDSTLLGERIHAQPGFRFVAATNAVDLAGDGLPDFISSRLRPVIEVSPPSDTELEQIVKTRFARIGQDGEGMLRRFWELWGEHSADKPPSPRDTIYLFGLTLGLADAEAADAMLHLAPSQRVDVQPQMRHLEEAFQRLFLTGRGRNDRQSLAA